MWFNILKARRIAGLTNRQIDFLDIINLAVTPYLTNRYKRKIDDLNEKLEEKEKYTRAYNDIVQTINNYEEMIEFGEDINNPQSLIKIGRRYGWDLPDDIDSLLNTLEMHYGITPEGFEGLEALIPSEAGETTLQHESELPEGMEDKMVEIIKMFRRMKQSDSKLSIMEELDIPDSKWNHHYDKAYKEAIQRVNSMSVSDDYKEFLR